MSTIITIRLLQIFFGITIYIYERVLSPCTRSYRDSMIQAALI